MTQTPGLIIAAPGSDSGKTVVTLGLLRALRDRGQRIIGAKAGPDYIDPLFHAVASGQPAFNLDPWAMRHDTIARLVQPAHRGGEMIIAEGVMGLFDGANLPGQPDNGSTADLAALTGWPVVLVVDAARQAASVAALVSGFANHRRDITICGVIFNRVGSLAHTRVLQDAMAVTLPDIPIMGTIPRNAELMLPERHLGLVPAHEHTEIETFIAGAARILSEAVDLDTLVTATRPCSLRPKNSDRHAQIDPLGQRIAIARDDAFAFTYPSVLTEWQRDGAELDFFSPLADEAPAAQADAVYLPGGYPELHAAQLAGATNFKAGLRAAVSRNAQVFGECGGYMVLGQGLVDAAGDRHEMTGLLPVETSFASRRLHLGYRQVTTTAPSPLGPEGAVFRGHEFHYASILTEDNATPLFATENARGDDLGTAGTAIGSAAGSFIHLIDRTTV